MQLFSTCGVSEQFKLTLPPTCRILSLPPKVTINAPGIMNFNRVLKSEGSSLVGDNYFSIDTVELSPDGYGELKKALAEIDAVERQLPGGRSGLRRRGRNEGRRSVSGGRFDSSRRIGGG